MDCWRELTSKGQILLYFLFSSHSTSVHGAILLLDKSLCMQ